MATDEAGPPPKNWTEATLIASARPTEPPLMIFSSRGTAGISLALHRRKNGWYVVLPRAYGMAASKYMAQLNCPQPTDPESTAPPESQPHLNHRFWFNCDNSMIKLDDLLWIHPPIIKVTGTARKEKSAIGGKEEIEAKQVEVLISEDELLRKCALCGGWETYSDVERSGRFMKLDEEGRDTIYWCGLEACKTKNSKSALGTMISRLGNKGYPDPKDRNYFSLGSNLW